MLRWMLRWRLPRRLIRRAPSIHLYKYAIRFLTVSLAVMTSRTKQPDLFVGEHIAVCFSLQGESPAWCKAWTRC